MTRMLRSGEVRVTNIELFFDLVYVFAVTQLAHVLEQHTTVEGAVQTAVLLAMVWQIWVYTTWMTNYLDPDRSPVRVALIALMLGSLVLSAALPEAFGDRAWVVAVMYVVLQVGRSLFAGTVIRDDPLAFVFWRLGAWSVLGAVPMLCGAAAHGHAREVLWALTVAVELGGAAFGFPTPGLGRSQTRDWTIDGGHFAERCQAFVLIALGESLVATGATLSAALGENHATAGVVGGFVAAFLGAVALWWIYFDRAAADSARVLAESDDPGRLGRSAFHWVHPVIVAGIIVSAAADALVLHDPSRRGDTATSWLVLGGTALFLAGHALFKAIVWRTVSWQRVAGVVVLLALFALAPHLSAIVLGLSTLVVVALVIVADRLQHPQRLTVAPVSD